MPTLATPSNPISKHDLVVQITFLEHHIKSCAYVVEEASANKPDADSMPTTAKNTSVDNVKRTHRRQSSLSSFRNHSLLTTNQGL